MAINDKRPGGQKAALMSAKYSAEEPATIVICRDIPGVHSGGKKCWCYPLAIHSLDPRSTDEILAEVNRVH